MKKKNTGKNPKFNKLPMGCAIPILLAVCAFSIATMIYSKHLIITLCGLSFIFGFAMFLIDPDYGKRKKYLYMKKNGIQITAPRISMKYYRFNTKVKLVYSYTVDGKEYIKHLKMRYKRRYLKSRGSSEHEFSEFSYIETEYYKIPKELIIYYMPDNPGKGLCIQELVNYNSDILFPVFSFLIPIIIIIIHTITYKE
ncbi:MAG: hypothetical protein FWG44_01930 [Oscillospiraceae bacterium]|nr:hypothetical protein [Oscillospiraceae bacterium]